MRTYAANPRALRRGVVMVVSSAVVATILVLGSGSKAWSLPPYPAVPPDFVHAGAPHDARLTPTGGDNDRPMLVVYGRFSSGAPDTPGVSAATLSAMFFGGYPSVSGYFQAESFGRLGFPPAQETHGTTNDGVVTIDLGDRATFNGQSEQVRGRRVVDLANPSVNFAAYDRNNDRRVDEHELVIFHVFTALPTATDPQRCGATRTIGDGGELDTKILSGREYSSGTTLTNVMTHIHETSHQAIGHSDHGYAAGALDLSGPTCAGAGNPGFNPLFSYNSWYKVHLGWTRPTVVDRDGYYTVGRWDTTGQSYLLYDPDRGTQDYFLVENRRPTTGTYDRDAADAGIVTWRVDDRRFDAPAVGEPASARPYAYELIRPTGVAPDGYGGRPTDAWDPSDPSTPSATMSAPWTDGAPSRLAVRAIGPTSEQARVYFDVRGAGVMVNPATAQGQPMNVNVTPTEATTVTFPVLNTGEATDTFAFSIAGLPAGWSATTDTRTFGDHVGGTANVVVTAPADAPTGRLNVTAMGRSTTSPGIVSTAPFTLDVVLDPTQLTYTGATSAPAAQRAGFRARVNNPGDDGNPPVPGETVSFSLAGPGGTQQVSAITDADGVAIADPNLTVPSGNYTLTVSVPRFGKHAARSISLPYEVLPSADLSIMKDDSLDPVLIDELFTYTLTVANAGPDPAAAVTVTDPLPPNVTLVAADAAQGSCAPASGVVTCSLGTVAPGVMPTVAISVRPTATGTITNTASVSSPTFDPVPTNNQATSTTQVVSLVGSAFGASTKLALPLGIALRAGPTPQVVLPRGGGGPITRTSASASLGGLVNVRGLAVSTQGGRSGLDLSVTSSADVTAATVLSGLVVVEGVHSECRADLTSATGTGRTARVLVGGANVIVSTAPSSSLAVPGLGTLVFNEQIRSGPRMITVNAVRLRVTAAGLGVGDIVIGQSICGVQP